jgi:hypothetical protein
VLVVVCISSAATDGGKSLQRGGGKGLQRGRAGWHKRNVCATREKGETYEGLKMEGMPKKKMYLKIEVDCHKSKISPAIIITA